MSVDLVSTNGAGEPGPIGRSADLGNVVVARAANDQQVTLVLSRAEDLATHANWNHEVAIAVRDPHRR